ncbi:MAG: TonB-dependent receptor [Saprospiraceae bacterium]|nr:TonB-dependent receptor [Saprospiraceae bacterium]
MMIPFIPAFNTPEHKFNIGLAGRDLSGLLPNPIGFNINYKWIDTFIFEGSPQFTGTIPSYSLMDAQVNYLMRKINTTIKIGASNLLNNKSFQTYGGPRIGRLAYITLLYEFKKTIN